MKLQRLKSVLFSVFAVVTVCLLGSCHRVTPRWTNSYFHREANVKRICDTMAGTYDMSYFRIYRTDLRGGQDVLKDSVIRAMLPDSAAPLQYVVGGYGDQRITIPNFPISLVAPCLKDTALARAVASAPLQNLLVRYGLSGGLRTRSRRVMCALHLSLCRCRSMLVANNASWSLTLSAKSLSVSMVKIPLR